MLHCWSKITAWTEDAILSMVKWSGLKAKPVNKIPYASTWLGWTSFRENQLLLPGEIKVYFVIWDTLKVLYVQQEWSHNCCANPTIPVCPVCLCERTSCDWRQADRTEQGLSALKSCKVVYHEEQVELVVQVLLCQGGHEVISHSRVLGFILGIAKLCTR